MSVHPTAIVGDGSTIGPGTRLDAYAIVGPNTTLGAGCHVHSFAVIGGDPQDRRTPADGPGALVCGDGNTFREGVTISRGTAHGGGVTRIGAGNLFMAHAHVGHDCALGDENTLANGVSLAGHVELADRISIGGHAALHQFVRVGTLAFIAANAMVSRDVPPYCLAAGDRARLRGLNRVGLERAGVDAAALQAAWRRLFRTPLGRRVAAEMLADPHPEVAALARFISESQRGICAADRGR